MGLCHLTVDLALDADDAETGNESDIGVGGDGVHGGELNALAGAGRRRHGLLAVAASEVEGKTAGLVGLAGDDRKGRERLERKGRVGGGAGLDESGGQGVDGSRVEGLERSCQSGVRIHRIDCYSQFRKGWQQRPRRRQHAAARCGGPQ